MKIVILIDDQVLIILPNVVQARDDVSRMDREATRARLGDLIAFDSYAFIVHFSPRSLQEISQQASLDRIWYFTFSPRISAAGYAASIFPSLRPEKIRRSWSKLHLFLYFVLQIFFLPLAFVEALAGKGSAVRVLYRKKL